MGEAAAQSASQIALSNKRANTSLWVKAAYSAGLLICGAFTTITNSTSFSMYSYFEKDAITGKPIYKTFEYEWFTNILMFLGMAVCLIPWHFEYRRKKKNGENMMIDGKIFYKTWKYWKQILFFAFPTIFDLIASGIGALSMGSFSVPASVYQMLNGSIMVFTPLVSICFLKRLCPCHEWWGIGINLFGLIFVGLSATLNQQAEAETSTTSSSIGDLFIGMACCLISQLIYAFQFVFEELTMANFSASPNQVVGLEGLFGFIFMVGIVSPVFAAVGYENDIDALHMIGNNPTLLAPLLLFVVIIALYNFCGQNVTQLLNCTTRTILEALRALTVWIFSMLEYYSSYAAAVKNQTKEPDWRWDVFGDVWSKYSYIQLIGFVFMVVGSLIFNKTIPLPKAFICCAKEERILGKKHKSDKNSENNKAEKEGNIGVDLDSYSASELDLASPIAVKNSETD